MAPASTSPATIVIELENGRFATAYGNSSAQDVAVVLVNRKTTDPADDLLSQHDLMDVTITDEESGDEEVAEAVLLELQEPPWAVSTLMALLEASDDDDEAASPDEAAVADDED